MAKWAERALQRDRLLKERQDIKAARGELTGEKLARRQRLEAAAAQCRAGLERHQRDRAERRAQLVRELDAERAVLRGQCSADRERASQAPGLNAAAAKLDTLRKDQKFRRLWENPAKRSKAGAGHARAAERREESDDEVRGNIPRELWPVFNKYRAKFKATDRRTRTEAFEEWAAEHPSLVREAVDAAIAELPPEESEAQYLERAGGRRGGGGGGGGKGGPRRRGGGDDGDGNERWTPRTLASAVDGFAERFRHEQPQGRRSERDGVMVYADDLQSLFLAIQEVMFYRRAGGFSGPVKRPTATALELADEDMQLFVSSIRESADLHSVMLKTGAGSWVEAFELWCSNRTTDDLRRLRQAPSDSHAPF